MPLPTRMQGTLETRWGIGVRVRGIGYMNGPPVVLDLKGLKQYQYLTSHPTLAMCSLALQP